jgi:hypothetical protein
MNFRASSIAPLFLGTDGLTDTQMATLEKHLTRHKAWQIETDDKAKKKLELTQNMLDEMATLTESLAKFNRGEIELSKGAKTYIEKLVDKSDGFYAYKSYISNKETAKGTSEEDECIELYNRIKFTDHKKLVEGDKYYELSHNHVIGHPDIVCELTKTVKDAKSSWNKETFPKRPVYDGTYEWQVKSYLYMMIGMTEDPSWRNGEVFHGLVDTPEELVPDWEDDSMHVMSNVPDNMRLTVSSFGLTDSEIAHMDRRINAALKYADKYRLELLNKNK